MGVCSSRRRRRLTASGHSVVATQLRLRLGSLIASQGLDEVATAGGVPMRFAVAVGAEEDGDASGGVHPVTDRALMKSFAYFRKAEVQDEIQVGLRGIVDPSNDRYDYAGGFALVLRTRKAATTVTAALLVQRTAAKKKRKGSKGGSGVVWELLWFASAKSWAGKGCGSCLFAQILRLARAAGVAAMLVPATNSSISFWLQRAAECAPGTVLPTLIRSEPSASSLLHKVPDARKAGVRALAKDYALKLALNAPVVVRPFYALKPALRYDPSQATHVWFLPCAASSSKKGGRSSSSGSKNKRGKSKNSSRRSNSVRPASVPSPERTQRKRRKDRKKNG